MKLTGKSFLNIWIIPSPYDWRNTEGSCRCPVYNNRVWIVTESKKYIQPPRPYMLRWQIMRHIFITMFNFLCENFNKTAFQLHVYMKDKYNKKTLKIHYKSTLKQYLVLAKPESVCTVSPESVLTTIWQQSWNSQWSSPVGNLKFLFYRCNWN